MIFFHLKNCLFPCISRQRPSRRPRRALFPRAFRFLSETASFPRLFPREHQRSAQFLSAAFVRSSSPLRRCAQNFLCILYKTAENPSVIFYRCSALKGLWKAGAKSERLRRIRTIQGSPWAQGADSPYQGEMARRANRGRDAGPKGLRGFEHHKFRSTLKFATHPLRLGFADPPPLTARGAARGGIGDSGESVLHYRF